LGEGRDAAACEQEDGDGLLPKGSQWIGLIVIGGDGVVATGVLISAVSA